MEHLMPSEVQRQFGVSDETLRRWANSGKIKCIILPSGHRRYPKSEVERVLARARAKLEQK